MTVIRAARTVSSGTVRKCERALRDRARELYAEAANLIKLPEVA
jgi:hypothetical protein